MYAALSAGGNPDAVPVYSVSLGSIRLVSLTVPESVRTPRMRGIFGSDPLTDQGVLAGGQLARVTPSRPVRRHGDGRAKATELAEATPVLNVPDN